MTLEFGIGQSELPWHNSRSRCTPDDVTRIAQEVKDLGANSIRMSCLWVELDPHRNHNYVWDDLDLAVNAVYDVGLDILLIIEPRRSVLPIGVTPSQSLATDYGKLCGAIASRYGDKIRWYEIGNEVNDVANFGAPAKPSEYLWFLRAGHDNIKAVSPNATVLAGALMAIGTGWPSLAPVEWVTKFYACNPQDAFDGISMHPYARDGSDFTVQVPTADNWSLQNITNIRAIMDANGDQDKYIYCTEWGFDSMTSPSGLSTTDAELEDEQANNVALLWNFLKPYADAGIIYPTTWIFMYRDWEEPNKKAGNHYGMVHFDYVRKAEYTTVKGFAGGDQITVPAATATAQAWAPDAEFFTNPGEIDAPAANAAALAWAPVVTEAVHLPTATATAIAGTPVITEAPHDVEIVTVGTGQRVTVADTTPAHLDMSINVTNEIGRLLIVPLVVSTANLRNWTNYLPVVVESDIGGSLIRLGSRHIGSSSVMHGSVHFYGLYHPQVGTHSITADVSDAFTQFSAFAGVPILLRGASGYGPVNSNGSSSGGNTPRIIVNSILNHLALVVFGCTAALPGMNQTVQYTTGSTVDGDGDWIVVASAPGSGSITFQDETVGLQKFGALGIDIPNLVDPQADITLPAAMATAQAWAPQVGTPGIVALPDATATAESWPPVVSERVSLPAATAPTAQAWPPVVKENVIVPAATATAEAWPVSLAQAPIALPAATATAEAWPPTVGEKVSLPAASASAEAWPPTVTVPTGPTFIDGAGAETAGSQNTLTMPAHQSGDLLLMYAFNSNFSTQPTLPSGWTNLANTNESSLAGARCAYKFAASSSETSGDWGSATNSLLCLVYRNVSAVGAVATAVGNSANVSIPALTLQVTDGSSHVVGMCAISNASGGNLSTAPSGMTTRTDIETGNNCDTTGYDTNSGVTSWAGGTTNHTVGAAWIGVSVELKA